MVEYLQTIRIDNKEVKISFYDQLEEDKMIPLYQDLNDIPFAPKYEKYNFGQITESSKKILCAILIGKKVIDEGILSFIYKEIGPILLKEKNERLETIKNIGSMFNDPIFSKFR